MPRLKWAKIESLKYALRAAYLIHTILIPLRYSTYKKHICPYNFSNRAVTSLGTNLCNLKEKRSGWGWNTPISHSPPLRVISRNVGWTLEPTAAEANNKGKHKIEDRYLKSFITIISAHLRRRRVYSHFTLHKIKYHTTHYHPG
jgi:hypothetical protein